jgi:hypothetical protein
MATINFAPSIQAYFPCPPLEVFGNTVHEVLEAYFEKHPHVRGYILDDQGRPRPRLALYVDGAAVCDRTGLSDPVHSRAKVRIAPMPLDPEYEELD